MKQVHWMTRVAVVVAAAGVVAVATVAAGCGGDDPAAAAPPEPSIGSAVIATTDPRGAGVEIKGGEDDETGVVEGEPALRPEDDGPPPAAVGTERAACSGTALEPVATNVRDVVRATLCLLNAERQARGMRPLRSNTLLARAAIAHAKDMVTRKYFAHDSRSGVDFATRIQRTGYLRGFNGWSVGENLGWATGTAAAPREMVDAWMASPGHRANILTPKFREIGIGVVLGVPIAATGPGATYGTEFGARFR